MNIGDTVEYYNVYKEKKCGVLTEIFSDMDGVITDFDNRFKKYSKGIAPSDYEKTYGKDKFWELADQPGIAFWVGMPWMEDGKNYWDYIKLIQYVDHTLFKIIENWVPWKANTKTGLLIEPHYLERNKFPRTTPVRSDGQTMTTGLHGIYNAEVKGEQINELYNLSSSSVITNNNLLFTLDNNGQRKEQGTNGNINIFDDYTNPFLRDANSENNQSSQAPINPQPATGRPDGYISHKSNVLLGNATKGKTSRRYFRTLRNGKETDF